VGGGLEELGVFTISEEFLYGDKKLVLSCQGGSWDEMEYSVQ